MDDQAPMFDEKLLKKLNRLSDAWKRHRRDLTHMIFFSLAVVVVIFLNLDKFDRVALSPVVKVIDIFGLLLLFIVAVWANYERIQGDNLHSVVMRINEGEFETADGEFITRFKDAVDYTEFAERGYPFMLMLTGVGIFVLNVIAYIVFGPAI
jgi:hypothetical protein